MRIHFQVIPVKCVGRNLHSHNIIKAEKWQEISKEVRLRTRGICECCGRKFDTNELSAHEVWEFDEERGIQRLLCIIGICDKCHRTIHYQYHFSNNKLEPRDAFICKAHYMDLSGWDENGFEMALDIALKRYRILNQREEDWKLDISLILATGRLEFEDLDISNLEAVAPGSSEFVLPYKTQIMLYFNRIPGMCLIDYAERRNKSKEYFACEICGEKIRYWHQFHDLRVKNGTANVMEYKGVRKICSLCRKTIYFGSRKKFFKHRKTTKHYMQLTGCTLEECREAAKAARMSLKRRDFFIMLKTPYIERWAYLVRKKHLLSNGANLDKNSGKWYVYPRGNLKKFIPYL